MNASAFRFGFDFDRDFLHKFFESCQIILPIVNTLTVHPLMLFLLSDSRVMGASIRIGYFLTEITLFASDWIFNFSLRMHPIIPYSGFYCGGPACRMIEDQSAIMFLISTIITANIPCFLFLVMRMHIATSRGLSSTLRITNGMFVILTVDIATMIVNIWGFTMFGRDYDDAASIRSDPELEWLSLQGGRHFIFGTFGNAQYFRNELYILGASLLICGPLPVIVSLDAARNLNSVKVITASNRTQKLTQQLLSLFNAQLHGAMLSMFLPLALLFSSMIFDLHQLVPFVGLVSMRITISVSSSDFQRSNNSPT